MGEIPCTRDTGAKHPEISLKTIPAIHRKGITVSCSEKRFVSQDSYGNRISRKLHARHHRPRRRPKLPQRFRDGHHLVLIWGFITSLNDILIPHLKAIFDLNYAEVLLIQFVFFVAYAVFGYPSGRIVEHIGYKRMMVVGLLIMAVGAILFIPAADMPSFPLFLLALIFLGAGMASLQVAANPYVTVLGPSETASSRLNLSQAFNSLGTTIGPPLGGFLILKGAEKLVENVHTLPPAALHAYRVQQAATVKFPYVVITVVLILLALVIGFYNFPRIEGATKESGVQPERQASI